MSHIICPRPQHFSVLKFSRNKEFKKKRDIHKSPSIAFFKNVDIHDRGMEIDR